MGNPLPLEDWPNADAAVSALWDEIHNVDSYVNDTYFFPGGRSKGDVQNDIENAKQGAQFFSDQTEKIKRGQLNSATAYQDWRDYPRKSIEPLLRGIMESADLSSVSEFMDKVVKKTGSDVVSAVETGLPLIALVGIAAAGLFVFARLTK